MEIWEAGRDPTDSSALHWHHWSQQTEGWLQLQRNLRDATFLTKKKKKEKLLWKYEVCLILVILKYSHIRHTCCISHSCCLMWIQTITCRAGSTEYIEGKLNSEVKYEASAIPKHLSSARRRLVKFSISGIIKINTVQRTLCCTNASKRAKNFITPKTDKLLP